MSAQQPNPSDRITTDPAVLAGKPVVKGTGIPVSMILNLIAHGITFDEIIEDYPDLTAEDLRAAVLFAASKLEP